MIKTFTEMSAFLTTGLVGAFLTTSAFAADFGYAPGAEAVSAGKTSFITEAPQSERLYRELYAAGFILTIDATCDFYSMEQYEALDAFLVRNTENVEPVADSSLKDLAAGYLNLAVAQVGAVDAESLLSDHDSCDAAQVKKLKGKLKPILELLIRADGPNI